MLMKEDHSLSVRRVRHHEGQVLQEEDLRDEQAYRLTMRRRHNIAHHAWGVVRGLELEVDEAGNLMVKPGMAVDGYGRELILPETLPLPISAFVDKDSDALDVWLEYDRIGTDPAPPGYCSCREQGDASPYRWQERPLIRLTVPDPAVTDPRLPESVPEGDHNFDPSRLPPDDPQQDWPVFLGRIERSRQAPDKSYVYSVDLGERPYIGLVGEAVTAPSGRAKVQIGAESEADENRFAVFVPAPQTGSEETPRLAIDKDGELNIHGETSLHGDLTIKGGTVEFSEPLPTADDTQQPWRIYRHYQEAQGTGENDTHELRIEMAGNSGGTNKVVVGAWSEDLKTFQPCLSILDTCQVIVHGDLFVSGAIDGEVEEAKKRAEREESREAVNMVSAALHSGMAGVGAPLASFALIKALAWDAGIKKYAALLTTSKVGLEAFADSLALPETKIDSVKAFVDRIKKHPDLATIIKETLDQE